MFSRKPRYCFSERLRQRQRRRRRVKNAVLFLMLVAGAQFYLTGAVQHEQYAESASTPVGASSSADIIRSAEAVMTSELQDNHAEYRLYPGFSELIANDSLDLNNSIVDLESGYRAELTIDHDLQTAADGILAKYRVPWGAVVAVEPKTGRVLALSSYAESDSKPDPFALRGGMPAASLFKVITAAAAVEVAGLSAASKIHYRGGNYTLNKWNYQPDARRDSRVMTLSKALATSCNPAFGRIGLNELSPSVLQKYAEAFGFNSPLPFVLPVSASSYEVEPEEYSLARTAAGFGKVYVSPLHAALIGAAVANKGVMMRPHLIERVTNRNGRIVEEFAPEILRTSLLPSTADKVLSMMEETVRTGTARKQFSSRRARRLMGIRVAAKTGTLSGKTPEGRYHWLIAAAPIEDPQIALASLVVDSGSARVNGTAVGRLVLEAFFGSQREDQ